MSRAYQIVRDFEAAVAEWVGAKYGVAVDNCTNALFLAMQHTGLLGETCHLPARTFLSVPMSAIRAGLRPQFHDQAWTGQYPITFGSYSPYHVWDSAGQLARDSYHGGVMCVSFQWRKPLPIGKGGMLLTDSKIDADQFRRMRYLGRDEEAPFDFDRITEPGYNMTMTPEQAARGLTLLELNPPTRVFTSNEYADLRDVRLFKRYQ